MKKLLIAGSRPEIGKLFELLLWQADRQFIKASSVEQCLDLAHRTAPDLLIVDSEIASLGRCLELCTLLKGTPELKATPLLLVSEPHYDNDEFKQILDIVDGVLPEPFNPNEIKSATEKYI